MRTLRISSDLSTQVDDDDYERVSKYDWYAVRTPRGNYAAAWIDGKTTYMHRFIMGVTDPAVQVDHKDRDRLNNQKENLRLADAVTNGYNRGPDKTNSSGYKGVSWDTSRGKWKVQIKIGKTHRTLGRFTCKHEAAKCYNEAAAREHGDFAYLNLIRDN